MKHHEFVESRLSAPFVWGDNDCVLFAVGFAKAAGIEFDTPFNWSNKTEALRKIAEFESVEAWCRANLKEIPPTMAKDGDIFVHLNSVEVFYGPYTIGPGDTGLIFKDRSGATCAFQLA